jgi:hypothetical protein
VAKNLPEYPEKHAASHGSTDLLAIPDTVALPTASASYAGVFMINSGGALQALYVCLRSAGGTWSWKLVTTG